MALTADYSGDVHGSKFFNFAKTSQMWTPMTASAPNRFGPTLTRTYTNMFGPENSEPLPANAKGAKWGIGRSTSDPQQFASLISLTAYNERCCYSLPISRSLSHTTLPLSITIRSLSHAVSRSLSHIYITVVLFALVTETWSNYVRRPLTYLSLSHCVSACCLFARVSLSVTLFVPQTLCCALCCLN